MAKKKTDIPVPESAVEDVGSSPGVNVFAVGVADPTPTPITLKTAAVIPAKRFKYGHLIDKPDPRDYSAGALFGAPMGLPAEYSLEQFIRRVKNQGQTSSCVGQAIASAVDIRQRILGVGAGEPSSLGMYAIGRAQGRISKDVALRDEGTYPREAMKGIQTWGIPLESVWPFDESKVNDELPWDAMQSASTTKLQNWYRIDEMGHGRVMAIQNALVHKYPVVFGTAVDQAFEDYDGKGVIQDRGSNESLGQHYTCIVGYRTNRQGNIELRILNSWDTTWGDSGLAWETSDKIVSLDSTDFNVIVIGG